MCRAIRDRSDVPIIIMTTRSSELDHVLGLRAGADEYLVHPVSTRELVARIEAITRRVREAAAPRPHRDGIRLGRLRIDAHARRVLLDGAPVEVTRKEFDLLHVLASHPETVVSRHQLMDTVWHNGGVRTSASRTLDTHVNSLRSKLGARDWILTVRGVGFRLALDGIGGISRAIG